MFCIKPYIGIVTGRDPTIRYYKGSYPHPIRRHFSVGIAYTLQAVGQKYAKASHAAIIMSLESVFALIGGMLILKETLDWRGYAGCLLTLSGVLLSQLRARNREEVNIENGMNLKQGDMLMLQTEAERSVIK